MSMDSRFHRARRWHRTSPSRRPPLPEPGQRRYGRRRRSATEPESHRRSSAGCRTGETRRRIGYRKRRRGRLLGLGERLLPCLPARQLVEGGTIAPYELRPLPVHALVQRHRTREQLLELLTVAFVPRCRRAVRRRNDGRVELREPPPLRVGGRDVGFGVELRLRTPRQELFDARHTGRHDLAESAADVAGVATALGRLTQV